MKARIINEFVRVDWQRVRSIIVFSALAGLLMVGAPSFAQTSTPPPSLEFDLAPFFNALNDYLPVFISLFAIVGGIAGAMALARFVIGAVVNAFRGGNIN